MKTVNLSINKSNFSQRNNKINPASTCGPTNMVQALDYAGWELPNGEFAQPEDNFTKFCRTNEEVLKYYKTNYPPMYRNWINECSKLYDGNVPDDVLVEQVYSNNFPDSFPPNEVHDVLNFAANKWMGFERNEITWFKEKATENEIYTALINRTPVVSSVKFSNYHHIITIVGFEYDETKSKDVNENNIVNYIIDDTYGRFNFETKKYDFVSGNDTKIERKKFLSMLKPLGINRYHAHFFKPGPATI